MITGTFSSLTPVRSAGPTGQAEDTGDTEKSFFEGPARHRSRSGEAGGSESLSDPDHFLILTLSLSKGRRGAGERNQSTKFNSSSFQIFSDCVPGQCITSFIFRVLRMPLNPLPLYLMWFTHCKQFLPKIPV